MGYLPFGKVGVLWVPLGIPIRNSYYFFPESFYYVVLLQERWSRIFTVFDNGQSRIVSRRPRRLAYGRRIRWLQWTVIEKINKEGHNAAFNPVTIHCAKHGMENRRFELGPPGESKLPLSNRKYTDFLKILIIRISISFWIFIEDFAYYFTTIRTFLVG